MSENHHKKDPSIPGETPTVDEHTLALHGLSTRINKPTAPWLSRNEREAAIQAQTFIAAGQTYRMQFPNVFNASGMPFNIIRVQTMFDRYQEAIQAQERLVSASKATTGYKNGVFWGTGTGGTTTAGYPPLAAPRQQAGFMVPPTDAEFTGIARAIIAMAELLVKQPGYEPETIGRRFGIVPTPGSGGGAVDPSTLSPEGSARFTGSDVVLTYRAPSRIKGVEMVQILCDRGQGSGGAGVEFVASVTHATFTDHHPLPPAGQRETWVYYLCFLDRQFNTVGIQSECDVTVQGRVVAGTGATPTECPVPTDH